jgi:F-type H+-transporting ATPase subunit epsilon
MNFKLVSLMGVKANKDVYEVIIPTVTGEIAVFPSHEPLVTLAAPGVVSVRYNKGDDDDEMEQFAISSGVVKISPKSVRILVDEADHSDEIIEEEAQAALDRAIEMRDNAKDQIELEKAYQLVDRHAVRLKIAELRRRKSHRQ